MNARHHNPTRPLHARRPTRAYRARDRHVARRVDGRRSHRKGQIMKVHQVPKRIQRKRTRGWKMPPNTVYVGRPSKWGNPAMIFEYPFGFQIERDLRILFKTDNEYFALYQAVNCFRDILDAMSQSELQEYLSGLRGKNLACWCALNQPCHADVLLELANKVEESDEELSTE